ncbi:MAG: arsenate reductase ArsC [Tenuifilaceae bacterium]
MKILILCTGNSCRSQMAHAFLQSFDKNLKVFSAGTEPAYRVNRYAIDVMNEAGIDISKQNPKSVNKYLGEEWDYVITVCGGANESCPAFIGKVKHRWHLGFNDPAEFDGTTEEILTVFRKSRDEIKEAFKNFYDSQINKGHGCGCGCH